MKANEIIHAKARAGSLAGFTGIGN